MQPKQIDVTCPCCGTVLTVDVLTAKVLRRAKPAEGPGGGKLDPSRWDEASERVRGRGGAAEEALEEALRREREKKRRLDELFEQANEKVRRPDEGEEGPLGA